MGKIWLRGGEKRALRRVRDGKQELQFAGSSLRCIPGPQSVRGGWDSDGEGAPYNLSTD